MQQQNETRSRWANAVAVGGIAVLLLLLAGPLGSRLGLWPFTIGFLFLGGAALLAMLTLIAGAIVLWLSVRRSRRVDRPAIALGCLLALVAVVVVGVNYARASGSAPIHDISTNLEDPVPFSPTLLAARGERANPVVRDARIDAAQRGAYPQLATLRTDLDPAQAHARALSVVADMGLELVQADAAAGIVEATAKTFWFGFLDDLAVRVRADGSGSVIDLRSVSRVGVGDLGANAARIEAFGERFAGN